MSTSAEGTEKKQRHGRRSGETQRLVRRNLLVDADALEQLQRIYGTESDSETVRQAIDGALTLHAAHELQDVLATRGGPVDAYDRSSGTSKLPVQLTEDDIIPDDDEAYS